MAPETSSLKPRQAVAPAARAVLIHGLRRSGTTILWETLRSDRTLRCYDEPFHPRFASGAIENGKGTWREMTQARAEAMAREIAPSPISPDGELDGTNSEGQRAWLNYLGQSHDRVVIDMVRCWNRLPDLHPGDFGALTVHLVRDPASWVAAHLLPSGAPTVRRRVAGVYRRASFFHRRGFFDNYQYQQIITAALARGHPVMRHVALSPEKLQSEPAFVKLLAFWWGANLTLRRSIVANRMDAITISLSDFCGQPGLMIDQIWQAAGWSPLDVSVSGVRPMERSFGEASRHWQRAADRLGIPSRLFQPEGQSSSAIEHALDSAA